MRRAAALAALLCLTGFAVPAAVAAPASGAAPVVSGGADQGADAEALAARFAPVVVTRVADGECGNGEHYAPIAVDAILGRPDVTLRLADGTTKPGPVAEDLAGLGEGTYLDLPGDPLKPGCDYSRWAAALGATPTVYARVATDAGVPDQLALQYWLFWAYNDWNDRHEGDWEMIQLNFDTASTAEALAGEPATTIFAQHEGGEVATWSDPKVHREGDHIAVYPGQGSHASYYGQSVWFGKSAQSGFGCDNTSVGSGVSAQRLDPQVVMLTDQPWLSYTGHWGEQAPSFNNGPTGPNTKTQWETPIAWTQDEGRPDAVELPAAPGASVKMFCTLTEAGSLAYINALGSPVRVSVLLVLALAFLSWLVLSTRWRSVDPSRLWQPRRVGETMVSAGGVLRRHPHAFALLVVGQLAAVGLLRAAVGWVNRPQPSTDLTDVTGAAAGPVAWAANTTLLVLITASIATAATLAISRTHRLAGRGLDGSSASITGPEARGAGILLADTWAMLLLWPVALVALARWLLAAPWVVANGGSIRESLAASSRLTQGRRAPTAGLIAGIAFGVVLGPVLGTVVLLGTDLPHYVAWLATATVMAFATAWGGVALALGLYSAETTKGTAST